MSRQKRMVTITHNHGKPVKFRKEPLRNDKCPCGSGNKYKICHLGKFD